MVSCRYLLFFLLIAGLHTDWNYAQQADKKIRIGTFDSRCIAVAYGRTDFFNEINELKQKHKKAREESDSLKIIQLEILGPGIRVNAQ